MHGYGDEFLNSITGPMVGHIQVHHRGGVMIARSISSWMVFMPPWRYFGRPREYATRSAPRIYAPVLTALEQDGFMSIVVGIDPGVESRDASGFFPDAIRRDGSGIGHVLVGHGFARKHGIEPGMELAVVGQDIDGSIANGLLLGCVCRLITG